MEVLGRERTMARLDRGIARCESASGASASQ
jgi:hypothetical protein